VVIVLMKRLPSRPFAIGVIAGRDGTLMLSPPTADFPAINACSRLPHRSNLRRANRLGHASEADDALAGAERATIVGLSLSLPQRRCDVTQTLSRIESGLVVTFIEGRMTPCRNLLFSVSAN